MAIYATVEDVKRIMRLRDTDEQRDAEIRASLDAIESLLDGSLRIPKEGPGFEVYYDVPEDTTLRLPGSELTVTMVRAYEYPSSAGVPLSPIELGLGHGYDLRENGDLILRPTLFVSPFEGATAQRRLRTYARVEVNYEAPGTVPRAVTEGVAFLAAGYYEDAPRALKGLTSEKIGDYSYTLGGANDGNQLEPSFVQRGMWFLKPFMRRQRVAVT